MNDKKTIIYLNQKNSYEPQKNLVVMNVMVMEIKQCCLMNT